MLSLLEYCLAGNTDSQIIRRIVSGLKGCQVPLDSADWSSLTEIMPLLSLSTLHKYVMHHYWEENNHDLIKSNCTTVEL